MTSTVSARTRLVRGAMTTIDRRRFMLSLPALALAPRILGAQVGGPPIRVRGINHVSLSVGDVARSVEFYQRLFGMPSRRVSPTSVQLQIGSGPQHLAIAAAPPGAAPKIDHFCLGIEVFDVDRITKALAERGVAKSEKGGPLTLRVTSGAAGSPSVHLGDPDGTDVQIQDAAYCGGSGPLGTVCTPAVASPSAGLIALKTYSHLTIFSTDAEKANAFYKDVFGMGIRSYQGPSAPTRAVGSGVEFLMFTGGGGRAGAAPRPASINHFCMALENFKPDEILKTLETVGIKPREGQTGSVGPLRHYISMRMENRGGAKEGTPELYFTDADGLLVQLQDVKYCGGSGYLGDVCPPPASALW